MGKDYSKPKPDCNTKFNLEDYTDIIFDPLSKVLDKKDKRNLVAIYIGFLGGMFANMIEISPSLVMKINYKDGDIDTLEFKQLNSAIGDRETVERIIRNSPLRTPSEMIQNINSIQYTGSSDEEKLKMLASKSVVNLEKINNLKNNNDPKISIDTLAEIVLYGLSSKGLLKI
jgi:hypothetical protein